MQPKAHDYALLVAKEDYRIFDMVHIFSVLTLSASSHHRTA